MKPTQEHKRLDEADSGQVPWRRFGPYLSERQWGTVREDYSEGGNAWEYFSHEHARSRAYRWGEDGIGGISDDKQLLCFALALWNGKDPILKERLFGLTNDQGNHGEDVKEYYFYQDNTPTHSYMRMLYKYPQAEFPYDELVAENARRKASDSSALEYELIDTGVFEGQHYFDVTIEYSKRAHDDILIRITARNHSDQPRSICLLPTVWFRNTWSWSDDVAKPSLALLPDSAVAIEHPSLAQMRLSCPGADRIVFCENETNSRKLYGQGANTYPKDGINDHIVHQLPTVNPDGRGTKASAVYQREVAAGGEVSITLRLAPESAGGGLGMNPQAVFDDRQAEADKFYEACIPAEVTGDRRLVARQAYAGMLWSKQFFHYVVSDWLDGDQIAPPPQRLQGRNHGWRHFYAEDIFSMPDKWEYPWFASWDLCFHTVVLARVDLAFAKEQVLLLMREWYMRPDGQVPAYEWAFDDVNPPVQVWAGLQIALHEQRTRGVLDRSFMRRLLDHGLLYFTWWVNRKDGDGNSLYQGGFLGLDNISVFDRSAGYLPGGGRLYQSDGTAWVGFFALQLMQAARTLAVEEPDYHELASKFFQHFVLIADALGHVGRESQGSAQLWNEEDGLFYDVLRIKEEFLPIRVRSLVSLMPLIAVADLDLAECAGQPGDPFAQRLNWFAERQPGLVKGATPGQGTRKNGVLLSFVDGEHLRKMLATMLDPKEMLSSFGIRSLSLRHLEQPFRIEIEGHVLEAGYQPAESHSGLFGGNSNWRGPIWMPINYLLIQALRSFHAYFGDDYKVECPTGSGQHMTLDQVADELSQRLVSIFERGPDGRRPVFGGTELMQSDPAWSDNVLFYEYFHGDIGAGIGASHQTGWTGLVAVLIEELALRQSAPAQVDPAKTAADAAEKANSKKPA
jgi:hypothetical protein